MVPNAGGNKPLLAVQRLISELDEARAALAEAQEELRVCQQDAIRLQSALAEARESVAQWMIAQGFATGHGDTLTDLLAELSWQIAEIKRDAIKWRDTPIPVPPGECPYPVHADHSIKACVDAGDCGCGEDRK